MGKNHFTPGRTDAGPPRAAKGGFPYPGHGTLDRQRFRAEYDRDRYERERRKPQYGLPERGRHMMTGDGEFTAICGCLGCNETITASWGKSGSAAVPTILRKNGWGMMGVTNRAKWYCREHKPILQRTLPA